MLRDCGTGISAGPQSNRVGKRCHKANPKTPNHAKPNPISFPPPQSGFVQQGEQDKAKEMILRTEKGDLHTMVSLFAEARTAFRESQKEVAIVLTNGRKHLSLAVDNVASVEALAEETIADTTTSLGSVKSDLLRKVAHQVNDKGIVFLLDAEALLGAHC